MMVFFDTFSSNKVLFCCQKILFRLNKAVYIANHTYQFCWQYAKILVCKRNQACFISYIAKCWIVKSVKCTLISFNIILLSTVYRNDWFTLTFNCLFAIESGKFISFAFITICLTELKKKIYMKQNWGDYICRYWLAFFFSSFSFFFFFLLWWWLHWKRQPFQKRVVIGKEEQDGSSQWWQRTYKKN